MLGCTVAIAANALYAALTDGTSVVITATQVSYVATCATTAIGGIMVVLGHWL